MSHLTQMAGLAVQNFVSAAAGMAVAVALIRGLVRRRRGTLGNFWVDLVRTTTRVLLPLAFVFALFLMSQGVIQNFHGDKTVTTVTGQDADHPGRAVASQEAIKELGTNGGGSSTPTRPTRSRTRTGSRTSSRSGCCSRSRSPSPTPSASWPRTRSRAGWCSPPCSSLWLAMTVIVDADRGARQPEASRRPASTQSVTADQSGRQHGGQGGPLRPSGVRPVRRVDHRHVDRRRSTAMHDSFTPLGGAVPLST